MRSAGSLVLSRGALARVGAAALRGALVPCSRRDFTSWLQRWTGVPELDAQIRDLRSEAAAQMQTLGDLQSELQRTRGELSAAHKKLAAAAAERASVAAGRAAAASAAETRALAAENAAEELKARLGEINRLTSTLVLSQLGSRGAGSSSGRVNGASVRTVRSCVSGEPAESPPPAEDEQPQPRETRSAAYVAHAAPQWVKKLCPSPGTPLSGVFPLTLAGRIFARPESLWAFCARLLDDSAAEETLPAREARILLSMLRRGTPDSPAALALAQTVQPSQPALDDAPPVQASPVCIRVQACASDEESNATRTFALYRSPDDAHPVPFSYQSAMQGLIAGGSSCDGAGATSEGETHKGRTHHSKSRRAHRNHAPHADSVTASAASASVSAPVESVNALLVAMAAQPAVSMSAGPLRPRPSHRELSGWATQAFPTGAAILQGRSLEKEPLVV